MLPLKKNGEQTWKPHQVNKIYNRNSQDTFMAMEKEENVHVF